MRSTIHPIHKSNIKPNTLNLFSSKPWLNILNSQFNLDLYYLKHDKSDTGFYFSYIKREGFTKIVSLPFSDYNFPNIQNLVHLNELFSDLETEFPNSKQVFDWVFPPQMDLNKLKPNFEKTAYLHRVPITNMTQVKDNMKYAFRKNIKQAKRNNLHTVFCKDRKSLKQFYKTYHSLRIKKFGKIPQSFDLFSKIKDIFFDKGNGFVLKVELEKKPIAFAICLKRSNKIYVKYSCSKKEYLDFRPNNILYNDLFEYAYRNNILVVDMGLSYLSKQYEGLVNFKESMGGVPTPIMHFEKIPKSFNSEAEEKLKSLTSDLTETIVSHAPPPTVTSKISSSLYPYFA